MSDDPRKHKANTSGDPDHDGLRSLGEYRHDTLTHAEDSDDDGDEVHDGCSSADPTDADTDDDGVEDGDEDSDGDAIDNADDDDQGDDARVGVCYVVR